MINIKLLKIFFPDCPVKTTTETLVRSLNAENEMLCYAQRKFTMCFNNACGETTKKPWNKINFDVSALLVFVTKYIRFCVNFTKSFSSVLPLPQWLNSGCTMKLKTRSKFFYLKKKALSHSPLATYLGVQFLQTVIVTEISKCLLCF